MSDYEARRLANIQRNEALMRELGLENTAAAARKIKTSRPPPKKRKLGADSARSQRPTRASARIASAASRVSHAEDGLPRTTSKRARARPPSRTSRARSAEEPEATDGTHDADLKSLRVGWRTWEATGPAPSRDERGTFRFADHELFQPNKSPAEMIREGCFGGTYFRPLYSKTLRMTIEDDWRELPADWLDRLDVDKFLVSRTYDPEVNKYKVACGQSIEEWEAAGWIDHRYDPRGWFQWYCRFFQGRRCEDDERQIARWRKCVGETGRWRRILLKRYREAGVRHVMDEGDEEGEVRGVSPVVHQTCHHWAWELRQEVLDRWWDEGR